MIEKTKPSEPKRSQVDSKSVKVIKKKQKLLKNTETGGQIASKRAPRKPVSNARPISKAGETVAFAKLVHQKKNKSKIPESVRKEELLHQLSSTGFHKVPHPTVLESHADRRSSVERDSAKKRERSREKLGYSHKDFKERTSEPPGKSVANRLSWFVSPVSGTKASLNISSEHKKAAKFMRNKSDRQLGVDEHRMSVEPTEKREFGKSQKLNPPAKDLKKNGVAVSSQLETKRLNGGSMIEVKDLAPPKTDTKRNKLKGFSKSRRDLQPEGKASSIDRKKLAKSFKSQITLRQKAFASLGKQSDRKEKRKTHIGDQSQPKMIDLAKLVKNLRSIHSLRGTIAESSSVVAGEESRRVQQRKNKPITKLIKKKPKKPTGPASVSIATKPIEMTKYSNIQRVDMVAKDIKSSDSSVAADDDSGVGVPKETDDKAATIIQKFVRGFLTRKMTEKLRTEATIVNHETVKVVPYHDKSSRVEKKTEYSYHSIVKKGNNETKLKSESSTKKVVQSYKIPEIPKLPIMYPLTHSDLVKDDLSKGLKFNTIKANDNKFSPGMGSSSGHLDSQKLGSSGEDIKISNSQYNKIMSSRV